MMRLASRIYGPPGVSLWTVPLSVSPADRGELAGWLDAAELDRAARFVFERDTNRFIVARGMLRVLLSNRLEVSARDLKFDVEPGTTKPRLTTSAGPAFNLSHSADRALVAVADEAGIPALGVDLELIEQHRDVDRVAQRFFSQPERELLAAIDDRSRRVDAFYACWTRKESVLKGVGNGLTLPLDEFDVDLLATHPFAVAGRGATGERVAGWLVHPLAVGAGWAGALAFPGTPID
jgi:4'-phosphopantetheinyl transferase